MRDVVLHAIETAVDVLLARRDRLVLAVSGGADSSVLLHAVAQRRTSNHRIVVASVDHGTGDAATEATAIAIASAARLGLPAISERLYGVPRDEASLREARWQFLRQVAVSERARVVTAHTLDDHIETVVMRLLRGSSARGLAGLLAESDIERPFLEFRRSAPRAYAQSRGIGFVEDPTNASLAYFRNRVRLELLPAIRAVLPTFEDDVVNIARESADLRRRTEEIAERYALLAEAGSLVRLDAAELSQLPDESLRHVLPSIVARFGVTLDRRGLIRLANVVRSASGSSGQLSGGFEAVRSRNYVSISRRSQTDDSILRLRGSGETRFGNFRFLAEPGPTIVRGAANVPNAWRIHIPKSAEPIVRQWHPGDRLTTDLKGSRRKVKRFFADAGVVGPLRAGWPVVICGDDVVWIPGIKSSQAAIRRESRMVEYTCERIRE